VVPWEIPVFRNGTEQDEIKRESEWVDNRGCLSRRTQSMKLLDYGRHTHLPEVSGFIYTVPQESGVKHVHHYFIHVLEILANWLGDYIVHALLQFDEVHKMSSARPAIQELVHVK
jgi:hypothetical protein